MEITNRHKQGIDAFHKGQPENNCPYQDRRSREAWLTGWRIASESVTSDKEKRQKYTKQILAKWHGDTRSEWGHLWGLIQANMYGDGCIEKALDMKPVWDRADELRKEITDSVRAEKR